MGVSIVFYCGALVLYSYRKHSPSRSYNLLSSVIAAFDVTIGGPPCIDYTAVNANRKGADGLQGSYLLRMGSAVQKIQDFSRERGKYSFYLAENAALSNEAEKDLEAGDLSRVIKAFSPKTDTRGGNNDDAILQSKPWHMKLNSRDHTPLRRNRTYVTNIPATDDLMMTDPPPRICFDDGYDIGGGILDPKTTGKAPGLMAAKSRLDDHPRYVSSACFACVFPLWIVGPFSLLLCNKNDHFS
jgi:hypothetical protein